MAREKATITVDRAKLAEVRRLTGASTNSDAVDVALTALIREERIRSDVAAYRGTPPTLEEIALSRLEPDWADLEDDTDWDAAYRTRGRK